MKTGTIFPNGSAIIEMQLGESLTVDVIHTGIAKVYKIGPLGIKQPMLFNPIVNNRFVVTYPTSDVGDGTTTIFIESVGAIIEYSSAIAPVVGETIPKLPKYSPVPALIDDAVGRCYGVQPLTPGVGNYIPGDILTLVGGTASPAAKAIVVETMVVSATIVAAGSGGTNGSTTLTGTTGTFSEAFLLTVTIAGGICTSIDSIKRAGSYSANPTNVLIEPVTNATLTGCTVNVVMGVKTTNLQDPGVYSVVPVAGTTVTATGGTGSGATYNAVFYPPKPKVTFNSTNAGGQFPASTIAGGIKIPFTDAASIFIYDRAGYTFKKTTTAYDFYQGRASGLAWHTTMSFTHEGTMFEVVGNANDKWNFYVDRMDGKGFVILCPLYINIPPGLGNDISFIKVNFGTRGFRRITAVGYNASCAGLVIEPNTTVGALDHTVDFPPWALISDSYGIQRCNQWWAGPYDEFVSNVHGVLIHESAVSGTGYNSGAPVFIDRLPNIIACNPKNVLIAGNLNDAIGAAHTAAVKNFYATLFSQLPNAVYLIVGGWTPASSWLGASIPDQQGKALVVLNELKNYPGINWVFVDPTRGTCTNSRGITFNVGPPQWFTGTGWVGATTGNGNFDFYGNDSSHPNRLGCEYAGALLSFSFVTSQNMG